MKKAFKLHKQYKRIACTFKTKEARNTYLKQIINALEHEQAWKLRKSNKDKVE